jgi:hypothetical protein
LAMIPDFRMTWDEKNSVSKKQILYGFFSLQIVSIECSMFLLCLWDQYQLLWAARSNINTDKPWPREDSQVHGLIFAASFYKPNAYWPVARNFDKSLSSF